MKKTFHLDLDHSCIRLRQGSGADAPILGEVALDDPHFETRLDDLRREAQALADGPLTTQINIPHSEILFTSVDVPEDVKDDAAKRTLIEREMDGQTPYPLDDLVIDWTQKSKSEIAIALVARETLDQAEDFAVAHGFNPQGFSADPRKGLFRKRPDFGKTAFAEGGGMATPAAPEPEVTRIVDVLDDAPPLSDPVIGTDNASVADVSVTGPKDTEPQAAESAPLSVAATDDAVEKKGEAAPAQDDGTPEVTRTEGRPEDAGKPKEAEVEAATPTVTAKESQSEDKASETPADRAARSSGAVSSSTAPSFSSRRSGDGPGAGAAASATALGSIASRISSLPDGGAGPSPGSDKTVPAMKVTNGGGAARKPHPAGRKAPTPTVRKVAPPEQGLTPKPANSPRAATALTPGVAAGPAPRTEAEQMTVFGARRDAQGRRGMAFLPVLIGLLVAFAIAVGVWAALFLLSPIEDAVLAPRQDVGDAVANAPARPSDSDTAIAPQPVLVPDDTVADVVVVPDLTPPPDEDVALLEPVQPEPTQPAAPDEDASLPAVDAEPAEDPVAQDDAATQDDAVAVDPAEADAAEDAAPGPALEDPLQRPAGAGDEGRYAATGVEVTPPVLTDAPAADRLDELRAPDADTTLRAQDSVAALAPLPDTPTIPSSLLPPPPPGERFELNENGRVVATADGALSPEGVRVTAGVPPRRPPPAPERPDAPPEPPSEADLVIPVNQGTPPGRPRARPGSPEEPVDAPEPQSDTDSATDASLDPSDEAPDLVTRVAGLTPRPRPQGLAAAPTEPTETAQPATAFEGPQPRARPASLDVAVANAAPETPDEPADPIPNADAARTGAAAASAAASALGALVPAAQPPAVPVATSPYAVARSRMPESRPRDFQRTVARTTQRQQQQQTSDAPVRVASSSAVVSPSGPTRGSVAQRATVANAINLSKVNLMGVYGTSSNRRALIRLPSGKFQKVKVGDRVDGGRVRAISVDALSYVKGGRQIVLRMPRG